MTDHLGSVRATVNEQGTVVHYDDYYPFGMPMPGRSMETPEAPRERFTGHEMEMDIDPDFKAVYYAGARYYDGLIGRWMSVDPQADRYLSLSPYNYAFNNPMFWTDPDGECPDCWEFTKGYFRGYYRALGGSITGTWNAVTHPIETAKGVYNAVTHPVETANAVVEVVGEQVDKFQSGDAGQKGEVVGEVVEALAEIVAGAGVAGATAKGVKTARTLKAIDELADLTGMLRRAAKGKGNFGIGSATGKQADLMGKAWVGEGYKVASDGKTLISVDGLRQYRPPSYKPILDKVQANFEWRPEGLKEWQGNGHLDINGN